MRNPYRVHSAYDEPVAGPLGFKALPPLYLLAVVVIVVAYFASAEMTKRWFYRERSMRLQR